MQNKPRIAICKTADWGYAQKETATAIASARHAAESFSKGVIDDLALPSPCDQITQVQTRIMLSEMARSLTFEKEHFSKKLISNFTNLTINYFSTI